MAEIWHCAAGATTVRERAATPIATLRLRHPSADDLARIGVLIGVLLPTTPNTAVGDAIRVIWIGPGEWLIIGSTMTSAAIEAAAIDSVSALCVGVGDGRCVFDVTGAHAADLLAKGTSIDLHPAIFAEGSAAMSLFAQINVVIDRPPDLSGFRLYFDISLRPYLHRWFEDALVEFN